MHGTIGSDEVPRIWQLRHFHVGSGEVPEARSVTDHKLMYHEAVALEVP